jgi:TonB family protein
VDDRHGAEHDEARDPPRSGRGGGLDAFVELLKSAPDRLRRPESLLMLMALLASLGAHMPPYVGLGALADYFKAKDAERVRSAPVEISFDVDAPADSKPADEEPPDPEEAEDEPEPEKRVAEPEPKEREQEKREVEPQPPEEEPKVVEAEIIPTPPPPPPPPSVERKQSVTQKSEEPDVEPPPDARFLAEESRKVAEETVAMVRDQSRDDPTPEASSPGGEGPEEAGDSRERDQIGQEGGRDEGPKLPQVAAREVPPEPPAQTSPPQSPAPRPIKVAPPKVAEQAPAPALAPGTVIQDPLGSFVLAPANPSESSSARQSGKASAVARARPNLRVSWRAFENTFGEEQLRQDRMPRDAKRRGAGREKRWTEFRAAIENYIVGVKPGNTTKLNAAADPFAAYLAAFHRHLHIEFANDFLPSLPALGELGNPSLVTKVEIVVNQDGTLDRVGVIRTSGNTMFDFGAFNAVQRGAPYPPTPEKIRSPDGRVYITWELHRDQQMCGTWLAGMHILKTPPRSPHDPKPDSLPPYRNEPARGDEEHGEADPPTRPGGAVRPGETLGFAPRARGRAL